jgi:carbonic anhydrase
MILSKFRNGEKFMGESHFVFENVETGKFAVLSFFMESKIPLEGQGRQIHNQSENATMDQWRHFFDMSQILIRENDSLTIDLNLSLLMGKNFVEFWRYNGSLTIPPCTEDVIWTVFKEPIQIFDYHFETFRDDLLFDSYRGPQPLYYRNIFRSFQNEILSSIPDQNCCRNIKSKANSFSIIINNIYLHLFLSIFLNIFFLI